MGENGNEYIEQDGKRYYQNLSGDWEAEKDCFGHEKVNTDAFDNPQIETDAFGRQIIETDIWGNPYVEPESKDDSGCYLTTACMRVMQGKFSDDCKELAILRRYRDTYVRKKHPEAIQEYYRIAPKIVSAINEMEDSRIIYIKMYSDLILNTINLICQGDYEGAFTVYREYGRKLASELCNIE